MRPRVKSYKMCCLGAVALLLSGWLVEANPPHGTYTMQATKAPPPVNVVPVVSPVPGPNGQPRTTTSAMDAPLRLVADALQNYRQVQDYSCMFIKVERVNGLLQPENITAMKVRSQPFSVYLRWQMPQAMAGQEVCYVAGRNKGMMRVHATGFRGAVGFVSIDPRDPRALENNRHAITEAGIANLLERLRTSWEMERQINKTQVRSADYDFAQRKCTRVETIHPDNSGREFYCYRSVVYFDKETRLPIRFEAYDWPRNGGPPEGDLLECYSYVDLRFNIGLTEADFRH